MHCPECAAVLVQESQSGDVLFRCRGCRGAMVPFASLQRLAVPAFFPAFERALAASVAARAADCPGCRRVMRPVTVPLHGLVVALDACRFCRQIWFEAGELAQVPLRPRLADDDPALLDARRKLAVEQVAAQLERSRDGLERDFDDLSWHGKLFALVGLPVEDSSRSDGERPWLTWGLAVALSIAWLLAQFAPEAVIATFGFLPSRPWRGLGLAAFTASFVHANFWHLFGNVYILLLVGAEVESRFGWRRLALLLVVGTACGTLLHTALDPARDVPLVGASDGISAVMACYALSFPWRSIVVPIPALFVLPRLLVASVGSGRTLASLFITMPACVAFGLWSCGQLLHAWLQSYGHGSVSAAAHVGGALAGVALCLVWRRSAPART